MNISYNWLNDFIKLPKNIKIEAIAKKLSLKTVEVEGFKSLASRFDHIIVAEVLAVSKHEKANRLNIVKVDTGQEDLDIVCGADNVEIGQKVALALPGAVLAKELAIKEVEIRGFKSKGMICASDELGLGDEHDGILVLDKKAKKGQAFSQYLALDDYILEIDNKSLSNRGDLWGHYGIARELGAIFSIKLKPYDQFIDKLKPSIEEAIKVNIAEKELCPRYCSLIIDNLEIKESPEWLKNRLLAVGFKPINNVVDITNYIMLELGQPMHAFDADKISDINVVLAKEGDEVELLDGDIKELTNKDLVIKSQDKIVAVAGVMGAKDSSVTFDTRKIVLESANFQAVSVRQTASRLNKRTESSIRFEKSLDPKLSILAIKRAASLIKKICPKASISSKIVDLNNFKDLNIDISFSLEELNTFLGVVIKKEELENILNNLGFEIEASDELEFMARVPSWRAIKDISIKEDIFEEIIRIYGYENIEAKSPVVNLERLKASEDLVLIKKIVNYLSSIPGMHEVYNYAFVSEKQLSKMNIDANSYLGLLNPLSENHNLLRQSLVPNIVLNVLNNQFNYNNFSLFELGRVFLPISGNFDKNNDLEKLPCQSKNLAILLASDEKESELVLKGYLEALFKKLFHREVQINYKTTENVPNYLQPETYVHIFVNDINLGFISSLNSKTSSALNLKLKIAVLEININQLLNLFSKTGSKKYQKGIKFPKLERDLAFVVNKKIMYNELYKDMLEFNDLITKVELFDVYAGDKLGNELKSLAFHFEYQSADRTLTSTEVDKIQKDLIKFMLDKHQARLRDF